MGGRQLPRLLVRLKHGRRGGTFGIGLLLAPLLLTGCSSPPWRAFSPTPSESSAQQSQASSSSNRTSTVPRRDDLAASGALHRTLRAGAVRLSVHYWSSLEQSAWTANAVKPLSMSVSAAVPGRAATRVFLQKVTVVPTAKNPDGALATLPAIRDDSAITPGYLVQKPNSYQEVFSLPTVDDQVTQLSLLITYELVLPAGTKPETYLKQSVSDIVAITLA